MIDDRTADDMAAKFGPSVATVIDIGRAKLPTASVADDMPSEATLECAEQFRCQRVAWLWDDWLARGKLHVLAGPPGAGKTTVALALAATISSGGKFPDGTAAAPGNAIIWSAEDTPEDTLVPRLRAAGADVRRVFFVTAVRAGNEQHDFDPARDMDALIRAAEALGEVALVIVDPIVNAVSGDSHRNTETRRALAPLVTLAQRINCAVVGISHFTKGTAGRDPVERVTGSLAFGALARVVMVAAKRVEAKGEGPPRLFARAKSNIGPEGGGFGYELEQRAVPGVLLDMTASVAIFGSALSGTAKELLGEAEQQPDTGVDVRREAVTFLRELLADGPLPPKQVKALGDEAGHCWRTLQRAMHDAGVLCRRGGAGQAGEWRLRDQPAPLTPTNRAGANGATDGPNWGKRAPPRDPDKPYPSWTPRTQTPPEESL